MTYFITNDCINCGACAFECSSEAIYKNGESWVEKDKSFAPISKKHFYIVTNKCNECLEFNIIRCISICPMDSIKKM